MRRHSSPFPSASSSSDIDRIVPAGSLMVWDTDLTYKYFRLTGDGRLLIGGGTLLNTYSRREQHRPEQAVRRLTRYLAARFPDLRVKFNACWPGLIGISKDFAPVVGRHPRYSSVHFAAGAAGLPWAAALGRYLAEKGSRWSQRRRCRARGPPSIPNRSTTAGGSRGAIRLCNLPWHPEILARLSLVQVVYARPCAHTEVLA